MSDLRIIIAQNVQTTRLARGLSQAELAARAGISMRYLREIEHGRANMRLQVIERLARALGTTPAVLAAQVS